MARKAIDESALRLEDALADAQKEHVRKLAAAQTDKAIHALVEIATATMHGAEPDQDGIFPILKDDEGNPVRLRYLPGPRVAASKALLEYGHGRPTQQIQHEHHGDRGITVLIQHWGSDGQDAQIIELPAQIQPEKDVTPEKVRLTADCQSAE